MRLFSNRLPTLCGCLLLACVPRADYDGTVADLGDARGALTETQVALAQCQEELSQLSRQPQGEGEVSEEQRALEQELRELREANAQRMAAFEELRSKLQGMIDAGDLEIYVRRGQMIIGLPSSVLFPSGKAELSKKGQRTIAKVAKVLAELKGRKIQVAGHTDNVPVGKKLDFEDNWELSTVRALTVTRFLVSEGVEPASLSAAGYAEFDPVKSNEAPGGRRKNRRIELVLVPDLSALPGLADTPE
jgi:chemotaxis protein MotB